MNRPQFARRTHRAREHLASLREEYPSVWEQVDLFRTGRGMDLPNWPEWCYLPLAAAEAIASNSGKAILDRAADIGRIAALAAWRMTQGIYRFDPTLQAALVETPITGDLPIEVLMHMPEWCVYIETPGHVAYGAPVHGAWSHLEHDIGTERIELRLLLDTDSALIPVAIHLVPRGGLRAGIDAMLAEARRQGITRSQPVSAIAQDAAVAQIVFDGAEPIINLVLYLCSEAADLTRRGIPAKPANPTPVRTRRAGWKLFPAEGAREWDVGVRLGAALRAAYQRTATRGGEASPGRPLRPHVRRAHWHTYVSGPRAEPAAQTRTLRWLPPIAVNVDSPADLPAIIHRID